MLSPGWEEEEGDDVGWIEPVDEEEGFGEDYESDDEEEFYGDEDFEVYDEEDLDDDVEDEEEDSDLDVLINEGEALIEEGEYDEALNLFREALERFPESPLAAYHVGQTTLMMFSDGIGADTVWQDDDELAGYFDESLSAFETALGLDENYYPALNSLGALQMLVDNPKAAIEAWERSLDIDDDQEDIIAALEEARAQTDD